MDRILKQALNSRRLKDRLMEFSQLIDEAHVDYARAMNRVLLADMVRWAAAGAWRAGASRRLPVADGLPRQAAARQQLGRHW